MNREGRFSAGCSRLITLAAKRKDSPKLQAIDDLYEAPSPLRFTPPLQSNQQNVEGGMNSLRLDISAKALGCV